MEKILKQAVHPRVPIEEPTLRVYPVISTRSTQKMNQPEEPEIEQVYMITQERERNNKENMATIIKQ